MENVPASAFISNVPALKPFQVLYIGHQLTKRSPVDSTEGIIKTLSDAQVDLNPHQIEAALFALQSPLSNGVILADEVGLGKTIEAGILLSQKWAENKRKLLVIAPANLRKQWNQELAEKFFLPSVILETHSFNAFYKNGNRNPFDQDSIVICSYQFAAAKNDFMQAVAWDLVAIDEAHKLRNVFKRSNKMGNAIKQALVRSPKVLLTATPLQNSLMELYGLVSIIDDHVFGDLKSFRVQFTRLDNDQEEFADLKARLKQICRRSLRKDVQEFINYKNRIPITVEFEPTEPEDRLYELVSGYLQRDQLYALPNAQKTLIILMVRKLLASSTKAIAGTLDRLAQRLRNQINGVQLQDEQLLEDFSTAETLVDEWVEAQQKDVEDDDVTEEYEQSDESSEVIENADAGFLEPDKSAYEVQDEDEGDGEDDSDGEGGGEDDFDEPEILSQTEAEAIKKEIEELESYRDLARSIYANAKGEKLLFALEKGFEKARELGAREKALIFTESVRTQQYLMGLLEACPEYNDKIVLFNGTNSDYLSQMIYRKWLNAYEGTDKISGSKSADMRAALIDYFKNEAKIMIATEAGAEGINLQFCSIVINYDLPWNPQRIEQRIGRCHRYGQEFDVVVINFVNKKNAADQRVFELLRDKFQLFSGVFGASDEVLGVIESGVDFEKRIAEIYQTARDKAQIQDAFDKLQKEMDEKIAQNMKTTREKLFTHFDQAVADRLRVTKEFSQVYLTRYEQWLWSLTTQMLRDHARFEDSSPSFTLVGNPFANVNIQVGRYRMGRDVNDAHTYRAGHPLAEQVMYAALQTPVSHTRAVFDYSGCGSTIGCLEQLIGAKGIMAVYKLTITSLTTVDYLIHVAVATDGTILDDDHCMRMLSLAVIDENACEPDEAGTRALNAMAEQSRKQILDSISVKNANIFQLEIDKLDKWAEDKRTSLKYRLKDMDDQIKLLKREALLAQNLPAKLAAQKRIRDLGKKRDEAWFEFDKSGQDVEKQKDELLSLIEHKLEQSVAMEMLFSLQWEIA
jgi:SNF2 family DNA or RNA helicase